MKTVFLSGLAAASLSLAVPASSAVAQMRPGLIGQSSALTLDKSRGVMTMAPLLKRVSPAVVSIRTEGTAEQADSDMNEMFEKFFGQPMPDRPERRSGGIGSGVIVNASKGYVMTNNHVVDDAEEIWVTLADKRELKAKLIGRDAKTDIAVIQIKARGLTDVPFSKDAVEVGDYVIAIGNPFGLEATVTSGIVSGTGRSLNRSDAYEDFIQTDASINPGNSGGALINSKGDLIGINSAILSRSGGNNGIGFAVPVKMAKNVMDQLVSHGEVRRGRIGVLIRDIDPALQEAMDLPTLEGALVNDVGEDTPAERAGLEEGDIIVSFNGQPVKDADDIRNLVGMVQPGASAELAYLRGDTRTTTRIRVEASDDDKEKTSSASEKDEAALESFSGARLTNIPEDMELRGGNDGVYVASVTRGSKAARAGLQRGDVIRKIGNKPVKNLSQFEKALSGEDGPIALSVDRDGTNLFLAVR